MAAVSTDASKQILQGIHMAAGYMEATDGHRMMRVPVALPDGIDLVLPASTMKLLQDRTVTVAAATGQAVIDAGDGITIYSRILDGKYPDVAALVPASFEHTITLDRHRFTGQRRLIARAATRHNPAIRREGLARAHAHAISCSPRPPSHSSPQTYSERQFVITPRPVKTFALTFAHLHPPSRRATTAHSWCREPHTCTCAPLWRTLTSAVGLPVCRTSAAYLPRTPQLHTTAL
jgi:hypothetical protein